MTRLMGGAIDVHWGCGINIAGRRIKRWRNWFVSMKKADFNGIARQYHVSPVLRLIPEQDLINRI